MKILWLATCENFYDFLALQSNHCKDSEGGWYTGLHQAILKYGAGEQIELGIAFTCSRKAPDKVVIENCTYYTLKPEKQSPWEHLSFYWGGYKSFKAPWEKRIQNIINDFKPDLIHFFGLESQMAYFIKKIDLPYVVNLLGILTPYYNAFFPINMNKFSVLIYNYSFKELFLNNQIRFAYKSMRFRTLREIDLFKHCGNFAGRTNWDRQIADVFAPQANYYVINEVLRPIFYYSKKWQPHHRDRLEIVSTISENVYKGYDLILKTAALLKQMNISFRWRVIGLSKCSNFSRFFERHYSIVALQNNIEQLGRKQSTDLVDILLDSDLFVHPSYIDNSPNSVCEAQYLGIPVVGCYVGGVPSLIEHGKTGWLVPANAPFEVAYIVKNYHNMSVEEISVNEIHVAQQRHNPKKIYEETMNCYKSLLDR